MKIRISDLLVENIIQVFHSKLVNIQYFTPIRDYINEDLDQNYTINWNIDQDMSLFKSYVTQHNTKQNILPGSRSSLLDMSGPTG